MNNDDMTHNLNCLTLETHFAPAGRETDSHILDIYQLIQSEPWITSLLDAMPLSVFLLNSKRQIVSANQQGLQSFGGQIDALLGKRPGELIGCIHAFGGPDGCGTEVACKACGAVNAILQLQKTDTQQVEECQIATVDKKSFDWKVTVSPIEMVGHSLLCLVIEDISDQKRRQVLERTFFHDIVNTVGALVGFSRMLTDEAEPTEELAEVIRLADELMEEVQAQRELTLAENGDLVPKPGAVKLDVFLTRLAELYRSHPVALGREIVLGSCSAETLRVDERLLKRVLGNMLKNALEASSETDTVTLSCDTDAETTTLSVHNPAVMGLEVKVQVFKRSFSTKSGVGRGIGTYSIKLLGEKYLGGQVTFTSEPDAGTTFSITLPKN